METVLILVLFQGLVGGFDNLWHHEITEKLPARREARAELALHAARELIYAPVFLSLGWLAWTGAFAWLFAALIAAEIVVTLCDFVIEDCTRRLPPLERVMHTVLAINFGVIVAFLTPVLIDWARLPTGFVPMNHGLLSWAMTIFGVGVFAWGFRNLVVVIGYRTPIWQRRGFDVTPAARPRTILVTGGTGFIGRAVCRALIERGDTVIVWTRHRARATHLFGPYATAVETLAEIDPDTVINGVVNLAGEPVGTQLWTDRSKRRMIESRVRTTRDLVRFIAQRRTRPDVLVNGSAIGFYGARDGTPLSEQDGPRPGFMSELCQAWETEAKNVRALNVRLCCLRIGFVLGTDGGSLPPLALSARLGLGAILGGGAQWISWIHKSDMIALILFALDKGRVSGPFNATAPAPVTQADFIRTLAKAVHRRVWLRIPGAAMRVLLGDFADLLLTGQRVLPARAMRAGFQFRYPTLERALENLCATRADTGNARDASQPAKPATEET